MGAAGNYPWSNNFNPSNPNFRDRWRRQGGGPGTTPAPTPGPGGGNVGLADGPGPPPVNPPAPKGGARDAVLGPQPTKAPQQNAVLGSQPTKAPAGSLPAGGVPYQPASYPMGTNPLAPGSNRDVNRELTDDEYQRRWSELLTRQPVMSGDGKRSDLPTWSEFIAQSGQFNNGRPMDPSVRGSIPGFGQTNSMPYTTLASSPHLPGKEMRKWKGGKYVGNGIWEPEGAGPGSSGGGPSGG